MYNNRDSRFNDEYVPESVRRIVWLQKILYDRWHSSYITAVVPNRVMSIRADDFIKANTTVARSIDCCAGSIISHSGRYKRITSDIVSVSKNILKREITAYVINNIFLHDKSEYDITEYYKGVMSINDIICSKGIVLEPVEPFDYDDVISTDAYVVCGQNVMEIQSYYHDLKRARLNPDLRKYAKSVW
ncbi:hypothetical protein HNP86_002004 [Methanococcus maripaludis]|uniref:Uncharacterized protein n=1 Tax=Methanococcus maripaludis TaxID=39152 RepID=A0A7J9NX73_METMI|nr:hypothetical protein [Methanococcus maripaludis]MBA2851845.1 hypothetical protein [Methanococcus maripaludis]